ncbi:MAG: TonB-dependent receptor [Acidobacteriia bacterium]|nr:TonB-dependent receptor [Terriglobia bacterium]
MHCDSLMTFARAAQARIHHSRRNCAALLVFFLAVGLGAFAQEATIVGTVTDPSGAVLPNVTITISNVETGIVQHIPTNNEGQYVAPSLRIGSYTVRAEGAGFKSAERKGLVLQVGDRIRVDFQMQVGATQETVTVEATAITVQSDTGEVSQIVSGEQLSKLASNGRSFYTYVNLTPGATSLQGNFSIPAPVNADANVSINGNRPAHNIYLLDGGEDLDRGGAGTFSVMPSTDAIAESRTLTSNYGADFGLSSAGSVASVLKSGTNSFHASAWEVFRNDALDANDYFRNRAGIVNPELRFNLFGFNVGGPIWKDKTFFFFNMEWRRIVQGGGINHQVPSTDWYPDANGDSTFPGTIKVPNLPTAVLFRNCATPPAGVNPGGTFPGNLIPACMIEPNSAALLQAGIFPANNSVDPSGNPTFVGGNNVPSNIREEIVRIDHRFNDKFNIFGHYIDEAILQTQGTTMWSGDNMPTVGNTFGNPSYSAVVHLIHTINPNLLNEVAFNYNGNRINILPLGTPALASPFELNKIFPRQDGKPNNISTINLSTGTQAQYSSNWTPWVNVADSYQIRDDLSWTRGSHQFKIGGSWQLYKKVQDVFAGNYQGTFQFDGSFSGDSFADYLLGYSQTYNEDAIHDNGHWNNVSWAAYIQDNWRATRRLTLNLGLRWDGVPHTYEANHRTSNFYPNLYQPDTVGNVFLPDGSINPANPNVGSSVIPGVNFYLNGIGLDGLNGIPKGLVDNHWGAFGPRLGFAYDLTGQGKTVVRGGFGMMYERIQGNDMYNMGTNIPFSATLTAHNVLLADPHNATDGGTVALGAIGTSDITGISKSQYQLPVSYQYSLGVQQSIGARSVLSVSYVGNQNRHQNYWTQINLPDASQLASLTTNNVGNGGEPYDQLVPFLGYHQIRLAENGANAHYNSLQTSLRGKLVQDLDVVFGYTYSKAVDPTTGNGGNGYDLNNVSNPYVGWKYDLGPSPFDRTQVAFASFVYDVPFLRTSPNHFLKTALGGWQVAGIVTMQSGAPLDITTNNHSVTSVIPNSRNRPDLVGKISYPHKVDEWFDTSAFADPAPGAWGNLGHAALRGPGRDNWNISLFKNFNFTERVRLEFRAESFNTFNHTQFRGDIQGGGISTALGAGDFGQITAAFDPRQIQLGLKVVF